MLFLRSAIALWKRELVRFVRQPSRVVGTLGPPILFWVFIGSGLGDSVGSRDYLQYFFPGTITLIVLFAAIFSTISVIEDRHEGFLQSVWVAPISRSSIVIGKIAGGATLAFIHGLLFVSLSPFVGLSLSMGSLLYFLVVLVVLSVGLTGLGFLFAWRLDSTQGFHGIMNLILMPMWFLSGALFPLSGTPTWLRALMTVNPLTYGISAMGQSFHVQGAILLPSSASPALCLVILTAFAILTFSLSWWSVEKSA